MPLSPPRRPPRVFVSAGEPSGDRHAAPVVAALRAHLPEIEVEALGGPALRKEGASVRFPMEEYTAFGLVEILGKIRPHLKLLRQLRREFAAGRYDLVLLVDYPGFNLRVAEAARRWRIPVLYYVAPQLWAWRPGRARRFARAVDRVAVILPFEEAFFAGVGVPAEYVGHPLVECPPPSRAAVRERLGVRPDARVLAVLPGSREGEVRRLWPAFREAASRLLATGACDQVLAAGAPGHPLPEPGPIQVHPGAAMDVLRAADAALAKSGTTTLEAAIMETPMVVAYRLHALTSFLARRMLRVRWISLVNLVAGRAVVPELVQNQVTADQLAGQVRPLLVRDSEERRAQIEGLAEVRHRLGGAGAAGRVARMAVDLMAG